MKTPEGYEKADVKKYLTSIGAYFVSPMTFGYGPATNDIVACIDGVFWLLEIKREGKEPTPRQNTTAAAVTKAGGFVAWGTSEKVVREIGLWHAAHTADKLKFPWERSL